MQPRISMITLGVNDLDSSIKFYQEGLGFPRLDFGPGVAFFKLNGTYALPICSIVSESWAYHGSSSCRIVAP